MSTVGAPGGALRHSPRTMGWPLVGITFAAKPILASASLSHAAARAVSALCSERALTLGMRRNSLSASKSARSCAASQRSRSVGMAGVLGIGFSRAALRSAATRDGLLGWEGLVAHGPAVAATAENPYTLALHQGAGAHQRHALALVNAREAARELADHAGLVGFVV